MAALQSAEILFIEIKRLTRPVSHLSSWGALATLEPDVAELGPTLVTDVEMKGTWQEFIDKFEE